MLLTRFIQVNCFNKVVSNIRLALIVPLATLSLVPYTTSITAGGDPVFLSTFSINNVCCCLATGPSWLDTI